MSVGRKCCSICRTSVAPNGGQSLPRIGAADKSPDGSWPPSSHLKPNVRPAEAFGGQGQVELAVAVEVGREH